MAARNGVSTAAAVLNIQDFFRHWTRAQSSGIVVGESIITKSGSADSITAAYMAAANEMLGLPPDLNMPAHLHDATTTQRIRTLVASQAERAHMWIAEQYPRGLTLYRGLNPQQVDAALHLRVGGTLQLCPLSATTSKVEVAQMFSIPSSPDLFTFGVSSSRLNTYVAKLTGVTARDVFCCKRQKGRRFPGTKSDDEWILLGTAHAWRYTGLRRESIRATVIHTLRFEPIPRRALRPAST